MAPSCSYFTYLQQGDWFKGGKNNFPVLPKMNPTTGGKPLLTIFYWSQLHRRSPDSREKGKEILTSQLEEGKEPMAKTLQPCHCLCRDHSWFHSSWNTNATQQEPDLNPALDHSSRRWCPVPVHSFELYCILIHYSKAKDLKFVVHLLSARPMIDALSITIFHCLWDVFFHISTLLNCTFLQSRKAYNHYRSYGSLAHMNLAAVIHIFITSLKFNCYL